MPWSPGAPGRPPLVFCTQSVLPVRVWKWRCARSGLRCHCDSQAACGLCARWRWGCSYDLLSGRGAMSCRVCPVLSRRVASCIVSRRGVSRHVISGHDMLRCYAVSCCVMHGHVASCHLCHVTLRHVTSRYMSRMSRCVMSRHVTSCLVGLRRVTSRQAATTH